MGIICGKCDNIIIDIGTCNEGTLFPDPDQIDDTFGKNIQVFECSQCGSLTMLWSVWPDGENKSLTYEPINKKYNELLFITPEEFYNRD